METMTIEQIINQIGHFFYLCPFFGMKYDKEP